MAVKLLGASYTAETEDKIFSKTFSVSLIGIVETNQQLIISAVLEEFSAKHKKLAEQFDKTNQDVYRMVTLKLLPFRQDLIKWNIVWE